ncbi:MAG: hypothetical protein MJ171_06690 [Clostridia bacterium]|nr:hypothetical protein [Clostridia bacterium]
MNTKWFKLDTAGLIFPAIKRNNWINVYRISVTLTEDVDPEILMTAVGNLKKRFPSFYVALRHGFFWNYLEEARVDVEVKEDYAYPLTHMSSKEVKRCALRVFYHQKRIAVEFFHSITDGEGASIYVRSLTAEYVRLKYGEEIEYTAYVLNPSERPKNYELEDSFFKHTNGYANKRNEKVAYRLHGTPLKEDGFLTLTTGVVDSDILRKKAKEYDCTVTAFLTALMIRAIIPIQEEEVPKKRRRPVVVSIAINLRKLFPSRTLRNFVLAENVGIDPKKGEYTLEELTKSVTSQMALKISRQNMASAIASNVLPQQNLLVSLAPLPLKNLVMDMVYASHGEKHACINISNLGKVEIPESVEKHVERMEFIIGVQRTYPNNCSIATVGNTTCINMIRSIKESELERRFFTSLVELGIPVSIETNRR